MTSSGRSSALGLCIEPLSTRTFLDEYWDRQLLVQRGGGTVRGWMDRLFSVRALERLVAGSNLREPFFTLFAGTSQITSETATCTDALGEEFIDEGLVDQCVVAEAYANGGTVLLRALERYHAPITAFCRDLAAELEHPVQANAFLSSSGSDGVLPHYDRSNIFVLQLSGLKHWRVWAPPQEAAVLRIGLPFYDGALVRRTAAETVPLLDTTLAAGDAMFLPRGYVHTTHTVGGTSLHLAVTVNVLVLLDVAIALLEEIAATARAAACKTVVYPVDLLRSGGAGARAALEVTRPLRGALRAADVHDVVERRLAHAVDSPDTEVRAGSLHRYITAHG